MWFPASRTSSHSCGLGIGWYRLYECLPKQDLQAFTSNTTLTICSLSTMSQGQQQLFIHQLLSGKDLKLLILTVLPQLTKTRMMKMILWLRCRWEVFFFLLSAWLMLFICTMKVKVPYLCMWLATFVVVSNIGKCKDFSVPPIHCCIYPYIKSSAWKLPFSSWFCDVFCITL